MSAAHEHWWGGFSPAARFLVPMIPILACVVAKASSRVWFRRAGLALVVPQAFIAADGWLHTRDLWPLGDGLNRILSDTLGWIGGSDTLLPSLRTSPDALGQAAIAIAIVAAVNVAVWTQ